MAASRFRDYVLLTIGYEGKRIDQFIVELVESEVECLIDIREVPISRKAGFSKTPLAKALEEKGIEYFHIRELGSSKRMRDNLRTTGDFDSFRREYMMYLNKHIPAVKAIEGIMEQGRRVCLMCYEQSHETCHRSIVSGYLSVRNSSIIEEHLT